MLMAFGFFCCYLMNVRLISRSYNHGMLLGYEFGKLNHLLIFFFSHFLEAFFYLKSFVEGTLEHFGDCVQDSKG